MIAWVRENLGTIVVSAILIAIVAGIIISMIKNKKSGRSCCSGSCAHCDMCAGCPAAKK